MLNDTKSESSICERGALANGTMSDMPATRHFAISLSDQGERAYSAMSEDGKACVGGVLWTLGVWLDRFPDRITSIGRSLLYRHLTPFVEITFTMDESAEALVVDHVAAPLPPRVNVFVSYSHKDEKYKNEFRVWMTSLERTGKVHFWHDQEIEAGDFWEREIFGAMALAKLAVLLVSQDFIASDFIHAKELPPLLARHAQGDIKVLWIPIRPSDAEDTEIGKLQAMWSPKDPLSAKPKPKREKAFKEIKQKLGQLVDTA
jgi:hypothetical protein